MYGIMNVMWRWNKCYLASNEITRCTDKKIIKADYFIIQSHNSIIELVITQTL